MAIFARRARAPNRSPAAMRELSFWTLRDGAPAHQS